MAWPAAQNEEHGDLGKPGHAFLERAEGGRGAHLSVAGVEAGDIGGQEAAAADRAGDGEDEQRKRQDEDRGQAALHPDAVGQADDHHASGKSGENADAHLHGEHGHDCRPAVIRVGARHDELDEHDRQEDRHRGGVGHAVREAPFVVVPGHHAHQRAVEHLGLVHVEDRGVRVVVEVDGDVLVGVAEHALERPSAAALIASLISSTRSRAWRRT
jgi:hypothetical protein